MHPPRATQGAGSNDTIPEPADHAIGRSRGGPSTKIHALVTAGVRPVGILLSPGQAGDNPHLTPLLQALADTGHHLEHLLADKAYSHPSTRAGLRRRGTAFTCPERSDQIARRASPPTPTDSSTPSSAASTGSSNGGAWPPDTTRPP